MRQTTLNLGLIGYPLDHSLSPQIHNAALEALGLKGKYKLYPVETHQPDDNLASGEFQISKACVSTLTDILNQMRNGDIHGLNVTIPYKQNIMPLLDTLTPAAEAIGAVNTIFCQENKLIGDNTDARGFWFDVQRLMIPSPQIPSSALVLGAGGSARAIVYALISNNFHVTITARRPEQAQILRNQFSTSQNQINVIDFASQLLSTDHYSLLVNTTPVGMHPNPETIPWPADRPLPPKAAVYDLVYNPRETLLVKQARLEGHSATTGMGMLIEQAALAFERWTGIEAPRQVMMGAVN
jgi:shikimate dehydrogenase